jgi:hypothetical protein
MAYLIMNGYAPDLDSEESEGAIALVAFGGVIQTVFGYPNDEIYEAEAPELESGIYELPESTWARELVNQDEEVFGKSNWFDSTDAGPPQHYFVGSKSESCSVLARKIGVEVFRHGTFRAVATDALSRLCR